jgi:excinuclease ABC subunit B
MGRAARHVNGHVIMYADTITGSMERAMKEVSRRRKIQEEYNREHGITPQSIQKEIGEDRLSGAKRPEPGVEIPDVSKLPKEELKYVIGTLEAQMKMAAQELDFERAALLRDNILELKRANAKQPKKK